MDFATFKAAVAKQFEQIKGQQLFRTHATKDEMWETYLTAFPAGTNPIYKTRTEHDCNCCKQFVRAVGNVVTVSNGKLVSIWDISINDATYQTVADAMSKLVKSKPIDNIFLHSERTAGTDKNFQDTVDGIMTWNHFFINIPSHLVSRDPGSLLGEMRAQHDVLLRSLREITPEAVDTVLELIAQNSLYRGEEHKFAVNGFKKLQTTFKNQPVEAQDYMVWNAIKDVPASISKIRNTSIGTLLVALSEGKELEVAVAAFEAMVAPTNYRRPTALVTKAMIENAKTTIEELGLTSALQRRYATLPDITINNILFANRNTTKAMNGDVFSELADGVKDKIKNLDKVEEVSIEKFIADILPKADSIEVMVENRHASNLVSLITAADPTANPLFKWGNNFSWSYNGDLADSIKERVKQAGGNVSGELCCRLAWDYSDDLDFHMREPNSGHIYFGNRRSHCGGMLDVDANGGNGLKEHPVENIFYERLSTMREGVYILSVNNYRRRSNGTGFTVEIDILGTVHTIEYDKILASSKTIEVAQLHYSEAKGVEIISSLPSTQSVKDIWSVKSQTFIPVNVMMMSPNHWDGQGIGNKHYFFMLDGCANEGGARGFFNEFLKDELTPHRKVIEMIGSKLKTDTSANQLSGLGFSSTQRNTLLCRVKGSFSRLINITF